MEKKKWFESSIKVNDLTSSLDKLSEAGITSENIKVFPMPGLYNTLTIIYYHTETIFLKYF